MTNISVIIVAGGSGTRMGAAVPKQFLPLEEEETILEATLRRFLAALPDSEIVVVLPAAETERWREICRQRGISETHRLCSGGATRFESVRNGIAALGPCDYIAVHDGVRPLVTERLIHTCVATAERYGTAVPAIRPADSFRRVDATTGKSRPVDRETLRAVQTPQVFRADLLRRAYKADYRPEFTDDASVVEANGEQVTLCEGERTNIKITSPADLLIARILRHAGTGKDGQPMKRRTTVKDTFRTFDYGRMDRRAARLTVCWLLLLAAILAAVWFFWGEGATSRHGPSPCSGQSSCSTSCPFPAGWWWAIRRWKYAVSWR